MPLTELKRDTQITVHLTGEQAELLACAARLEGHADVASFVSKAALKLAKDAVMLDEIRKEFYELPASGDPVSVATAFVTRLIND